jgi:V/A-type H+/Na+-transporting ATPase subunit I
MIERMKKVTVLVKQNDRVPALARMRQSGILHIDQSRPARSETIEQEEQLLAAVDRVLTVLQMKDKAPGGEETVVSFMEAADTDRLEMHQVLQFCREVDMLLTQMGEYREHNLELRQIEARLESWGSFTPADLDLLEGRGWKLIPVEIPQKDLDIAPEELPYIRLSTVKGVSRAVFLNIKEDMLPPTAAVLRRPQLSLEQVRSQIHQNETHIHIIRKRLYAEKSALPVVQDLRQIIANDLELKRIQEGMHADGPVTWLTGFIPADSVDALRETAQSRAWGLLVEDPAEGDPVPTKLKNGILVRMIQPVFSLLGTLPGYREYDVSRPFLIFFTIFVAMIIGDGGYGLILLAAAAVLHRKKGKADDLVRLIYLLSSGTIIWGTVTGTWFGSEAVASLPFLRRLTIPAISSFPQLFDVSSQQAAESLMFICFILGVVQLSLACLINFIRMKPELKAYAQFGWLSMLSGLFFLSLNLVLGRDFPAWALYAILGGLALIVIFGGQEKGRSFASGLARGAAGLFTTFLDSVSTFSNIISYIRLYAVGMSSVAIASSFNNIAGSMTGSIAIIGAMFVLLVGHGLNIVMGLLSVVVHGVRLNMLEFSGQLGMEWSGTPYTPIQEYRSTYFSRSL